MFDTSSPVMVLLGKSSNGSVFDTGYGIGRESQAMAVCLIPPIGTAETIAVLTLPVIQ